MIRLLVVSNLKYKPQSLNGNDGSETLAVIIAGIPENVNLSSGKQSGNDEYTTL